MVFKGEHWLDPSKGLRDENSLGARPPPKMRLCEDAVVFCNGMISMYCDRCLNRTKHRMF